jgi:hypothetical protein
MPCHHALAEALRAYIDAANDRKGWLFRTARGHNGTTLSEASTLLQRQSYGQRLALSPVHMYDRQLTRRREFLCLGIPHLV